MAQYQLPNDFFFGAAMSGPQTEGQWNQGGKLENLWDTWSIQDLGSFYNRVGSSPAMTLWPSTRKTFAF